MATTVYFRQVGSPDSWRTANMQFGAQNTDNSGNAKGWRTGLLSTSRGANTLGALAQVTSVSGPTNGVDAAFDGTTAYDWLSLPFAADTTISGTITFNLWGTESSMSANAAINCILERIDSTGAIISTIVKTTRTTELGTTSAAANFTATPTSTTVLKGERIRARVFFDDAGTMGSGFTLTFTYARDTGGADGDSFITFNETFSFQTADPSGTTLYLLDSAGPDVGSNIEKLLGSSRGASSTTIDLNNVAGWTDPIQWTDTGGGTAVEWYSPRCAAFTLANIVKTNIRCFESGAGGNGSQRVELAVCDADGSNVSVWAAANMVDAASLGAGATTSPTNAYAGEIFQGVSVAIRGYLAGQDLAVAAGQRLRVRVLLDDTSDAAMGAGGIFSRLDYNGPTGGTTGDSFITLGQSITFLTAAPVLAASRPVNRFRHLLLR